MPIKDQAFEPPFDAYDFNMVGDDCGTSDRADYRIEAGTISSSCKNSNSFKTHGK